MIYAIDKLGMTFTSTAGDDAIWVAIEELKYQLLLWSAAREEELQWWGEEESFANSNTSTCVLCLRAFKTNVRFLFTTIAQAGLKLSASPRRAHRTFLRY